MIYIVFFDLDRDYKKVSKEVWLICPNQTEMKRFTKNKNNQDKFFEFIFIDSGIVVDAHGYKPPLIRTIKEIKINYSRKNTKN